MESYAVIWRNGTDPTYAGKLELGETVLHLRGSSSGGTLDRRSIPYSDIGAVRIVRSPSDRLNGSPTVVLDRRAAASISIAAVNGIGIVFELGDVLAELAAKEATASSRVVVVVPIRRGARERVRHLIAAGPPFDPESMPLEHHRVFVTEREAVFLFEGPDVRTSIEQLVRRPRVWKAAAAWKDCLAGPPRIADEPYSWVSSERPEKTGIMPSTRLPRA